MICPLGLKLQKIHDYTNDCILFRGDYKDLDSCPRCHASRYKTGNDAMMQAGREKRSVAKVMWYFPIIPRFKHLFATTKTVKLMRWHVEDRVNDGMLRHPTDGA